MNRVLFAALAAAAALVQVPAFAQEGAAPATALSSATTIGSFRNSPVVTTDGGATGTIAGVYSTDAGQHYAAVDFGGEIGERQVPLGRFEYEGDQLALRGIDAAQLTDLSPFAADAPGLTQMADDAPISILGYAAAAAGEASVTVEQMAAQVRVEQPALAIAIEQAAPQISVRQPTPQVSVRQLQPVIIVRQPPPVVTVHVPEPEIIVKVPDPEVAVAMAEPEIHVNVPQPEVHLQQQQPQVAVAAKEPVVALLPRGDADVSIQNAQPQVQFERLGDPQIVVQEQGDPKISYEKLTAAEALALDPLIQPLATETTTEVHRPTLLAALPEKPLVVADIQGRDVYGSDGDILGIVSAVVTDASGETQIVLDRGSGSGEGKVLLPSSTFRASGEGIALAGMTNDEVDALDVWNEDMTGYTPAANDAPVALAVQ